MIIKLVVFMKHIKRLEVVLLMPTQLIEQIHLIGADKVSIAVTYEASLKA